MKKTVILIFTSLILFGCKTKMPLVENSQTMPQLQEQAKATNFSDQTTWLLGYFTPDQMKRAPHSEWFIKEYDWYKSDNEAVNKLTALRTDNLSIKIVMGSWCPDSRREVPRFMRIIDQWKFPVSKITFIGVDNAKVSPVGEYPGLGIQRVPTFIFYKNNVEEGRIIENPVTSLEQDMVNILTRE